MSDAALLDVAEAVVTRLQRSALGADVDDEGLRARVVRLQRCESAVHAEKLRSIAEVESRKAFVAARSRSVADWLRAACGLTAGEARRQAGTAAGLCRLPATAGQLAGGVITPGHAEEEARGLAELDAQAALRRRDAGDDVAAWEAAVVLSERLVGELDGLVAAQAPTADRRVLRRRIDAWTSENDPDVAVDRDRRGPSPPAVSMTTAPAVSACTTPSPPSPSRRVTADSCPPSPQRPHQLLIRTLDGHGNDTTPAHLDGVGPVSPATAALIGCDADTTTITRDATGRIFDVGRADGDPSRTQRRAVIARDTTCVGCGAPAARCHLHHIQWRRHGGPTTIDNLVLVCWSCHHGIHHLNWTITATPHGYTINPHPNETAGLGAGAREGPAAAGGTRHDVAPDPTTPPLTPQAGRRSTHTTPTTALHHRWHGTRTRTPATRPAFTGGHHPNTAP